MRIRSGRETLTVAIYREMSFFKEVCNLLESKAAPHVAANETVISRETDEQPMEVSVVPTIHELRAATETESRCEPIPGNLNACRNQETLFRRLGRRLT